MTTETPELPQGSADLQVKVRGLDQDSGLSFDHSPTQDVLDQIAAFFELLSLKKLRFAGSLSPVGKNDWQLKARLGATLRQPCVISGAPVTTRIDHDVSRLYLADVRNEPNETETEFDGRDDVEPLRPVIDLMQVLCEALALEIPDYPRSPDASLADATVAPPGVTPLSDADVKPFAALQALKDKLEDKG